MGLDCHIGALHSLKQNGPHLMRNGQVPGSFDPQTAKRVWQVVTESWPP